MLSRHVSENDREEAMRLDQDAVRFHPEKIVDSLHYVKVGHFDALAVRNLDRGWRLYLFLSRDH